MPHADLVYIYTHMCVYTPLRLLFRRLQAQRRLGFPRTPPVPMPLHPVPKLTLALVERREREFLRRANRILKTLRSPFYVVANWYFWGQLGPPPRWDLVCTSHAWDRIFSQWRNYIFDMLYLAL